MTSVVLSLICSCVFGEKKKTPKNRNNVAFFSYFQLRTPVEKVLPCGHPAVNECLLHHSLQRYPPASSPPSPYSSTLHMLPVLFWKMLAIALSLTSLVFLCACLSMKYQTVFLYNLQKKNNVRFLCHDSLHDEVSFLYTHIILTFTTVLSMY